MAASDTIYIEVKRALVKWGINDVSVHIGLLPTSYQFHAGNRLRVTIASADAGNFDTPVLDPSPALLLLRDTSHRSSVELPIVQNP